MMSKLIVNSRSLSIVLATTWAISLLPSAVQAQSFGQKLISESTGSSDKGLISHDQSKRRGSYHSQEISLYKIRSEKHVSVLNSATITTSSMRGQVTETIGVNDVLYSASEDGRLFCGVAGSRPGYCLEDIDSDGVFDVSYTYNATGQAWNFLAFTENGNMVAANFRSPRRIAPISYRALADEVGPRVPAKLSVVTNYSDGQPMKDFKGRLRLVIGDNRQNEFRAESEGFELDARGYAQATLMGAVVEFRRLPSGEIEYHILQSIFPESEQVNLSPF